eukprot:1494655-Alexandrium_andersonii.AAC.1
MGKPHAIGFWLKCSGAHPGGPPASAAPVPRQLAPALLVDVSGERAWNRAARSSEERPPWTRPIPPEAARSAS